MVTIQFKHIILLTFLLQLVVSMPHRFFATDNGEFAEMGEHFEGDIVMNPRLKKILESDTGLMDFKYRWPNQTVYFRIVDEHFTDEQFQYILESIQVLLDVTCLDFRFANDDMVDTVDFIEIRGDGGGCYSEVGRVGGGQVLNLQPYPLEVGCFRKYSIVHEFLHALGFFHMQSASDRDEYVEIVWDKIQEDKKHNFEWYGYNEITHFGVPYDYGSVMHYPRVSFSIDGKSETIIPIKNRTAVIGQRVRLSEGDILKVNRMYGCPEPSVSPTEPTTLEPTTNPPTTTETPTTKNPKEILKEILESLINAIIKGILGDQK
jgi:hypothetical protein